MGTGEINRYIHVEIIGRCWHEIVVPQYGDSANCKKCGEFVHFEIPLDNILISKNPDYCSDESRRSLLNEAVAKVTLTLTGFKRYYAMLVKILIADSEAKGNGGLLVAGQEVLATAEQIARACVEAHKTPQP